MDGRWRGLLECWGFEVGVMGGIIIEFFLNAGASMHGSFSCLYLILY